MLCWSLNHFHWTQLSMDSGNKLIPITRNWRGGDYWREKKKKKREKGLILHKASRKSICLPTATSHILSQTLPRPQGLLYNVSGLTSAYVHKSNNSSKLWSSPPAPGRCLDLAVGIITSVILQIGAEVAAQLQFIAQSSSWRSAEEQDVFHMPRIVPGVMFSTWSSDGCKDIHEHSCVIDVDQMPMKGAGPQHPDHSKQLASLLHRCWF